MKDRQLTPDEELKEYFKNNDITAGMSLEHVPQVKDEYLRVYKRAKDLFSGYWKGNLPELGVKRKKSNFSINHPANFLENADSTLLAEEIAEIFGGDEYDDYIENFFVIYEVPFNAGIEAYCKKENKSPDDLTDEEIMYVFEKVVDVINAEQIKAVMIGQQVPELFNLIKQYYSYEDLNSSIKENKDFINFQKKWTHSDTKLGAPLSLEELQEIDIENGTEIIDSSRSFFDDPDDDSITSDSQKRAMDICDMFSQTLGDTDREIFEMMRKEYTQVQIAEKLGYKTHSAVTKRIKKINESLKAFCEEYVHDHSDEWIDFEKLMK